MNTLKRNKNLKREKGIKISKSYQNESQSSVGNIILMWFVRVLVIFTGTFGALYSFVSGYELNYEIQFFITVSLFCAVLFGTLYGFKRISVCVFPASALLLLIIAYLNGTQFYSFFIRTWNECVRFLALHTFQFPEASTTGLVLFNETFIWLLIALMFSVIIGFFSVCKTHFLPVFILTFAPMELALYFGFVPNLFSVICIFACNAAVLSMSTVKLKKKYFVNSQLSKRGLSMVSLIMCIFFAAALCISSWGIAISGYERPEVFNKIRKNFSSFKLEDLMSDKKQTIDLRNQSKREFDMNNDLTVLMSLEKNAVYLKCTTGSVYEDNQWFDFDSQVYKEAPVSIMNNNSITVSDLFATTNKGKRSVGLMTITPVFDVSGFTYLPYGFYNDGSLTVNNDEGAIVTEKDTMDGYSISYDKRVNNFWGELQRDAYFFRGVQYPELSRSYTDFVNEHYVDVPDNLTRLKEKAQELKVDVSTKRISIIESVTNVKEYLRENAEYSLQPGAVPNGQDFTEHFLFENKKGFCVHFATAGVMLLRAMGIPSRYASGYVITEDDFILSNPISDDDVTVSYLEDQKVVQGKVEQKTVSITLTDENAHAWVEVYVDGLGWIPCEMTPGYSQSEYGLGDMSYEDTEPETISESDNTTDEPETTTPPTTAPVYEHETNSYIEDNFDGSSGVGLNVLLIILAVIVLIVVADLIARLVIVKRRLRSFKGRKRNKNAQNLYLYLEKILSYAEFKDLEKENLTKGFEKIFRRFDFVDEEKCVETVMVLQKLFYGNMDITEEEFVVVEKFVLEFVNNFINRQNKFKKLIYKYILFLV